MEYNALLKSFLSKNVTSHEFQFFSKNKVGQAIIEFNLFLKGNNSTTNFGELLMSIYSPQELFKNEQFSRWTLLKIGPYELNLSKEDFNTLIHSTILINKIIHKYFNITSKVKRTKEDTSSSYIVTPYSKDELQSCNKINLNLHDFQTRIKDRITNYLQDKSKRRILVQMPTGSGKTRTAVEYIIDNIRTSSSTLYDHNIYIWFTNSIELSQQALDTFNELWKFKGDRSIGAHKLFGNTKTAEIYEAIVRENVSIIFAGFQKFNSLFNSAKESDAKLLQIIRENNILAVIDEAHISIAHTYDLSIEYVTSFSRNKLIGLTATPGRNSFIQGDSDNERLASKFHSNIIQISFKNQGERSPIDILQNQGFLAKVRITEIENISNISAKTPLDELAYDLERNKNLIREIEERYSEGKSILIFSASTDHSVILKLCLKTLNIPSEIIDSNTDAKIRNSAIEEFKSGKLKILINFGVLSTGFDAPILNCLVIARPISSIVLYSQILGRALRGRKNGGHDENEVVIIKDKLVNYANPSFLYSYWSSFWN
jgi:superfamily II DNA or RNA helicase